MNKKMAAMMVMAGIMGTSASAMAAANPFSDVPADHWAYDAVAKLAADGVIEGYGDGSFKGNRNITRYEMAQMVAKAMAKNTAGADKAIVDKLAAEFAEELNNLGVRVSNLERNADMLKWTGELRYIFQRTNNEGAADKSHNRAELRLFPTAEVNDHWHVKARITARNDMKNDTTTNATLTYIYAEGAYKNFTVAAGKMPLSSTNDEGLVVEDFFSGVQLTFGKKLQTVLEYGRWNLENSTVGVKKAADYQGIQFNYNSGKVFAGLGYRHLSSDSFKGTTGVSANEDNFNIWSAGVNYRFDKNFSLAGAYAQNSSADNYAKAGNICLNYKGINRKNPGTWGAYAAYRYIGRNASLASTYNTISFGGHNRKGWEIGASYVPFKNVTTDVAYFQGKNLETGKNSNTLFARARFMF